VLLGQQNSRKASAAWRRVLLLLSRGGGALAGRRSDVLQIRELIRRVLLGDADRQIARLERSLRSLYCCSDGVSGRGAPVKYLSRGCERQ
jgi:hypothetical protein